MRPGAAPKFVNAWNGESELFRILLTLSFYFIAGNTALHTACGSLTADPHRLGNSSYIPSTLFIGPNTNIVKMLLSYGAKVRQRNNQVICLTSIVCKNYAQSTTTAGPMVARPDHCENYLDQISKVGNNF